MAVPILNPRTEWECPNCDQTDVTHVASPHTRMHTCPGLKMMTAPFVPRGTRCKVEAHEREEYVGNELVTLNEDGRPIMSIETTRDDGNDIAVFAPCVRGRVSF